MDTEHTSLPTMTRTEIDAILAGLGPDYVYGLPTHADITTEALFALCTALLESMDRVEETKRHVEFLDQVIETNIRDNGVEENSIILRDGTVLTGPAVDVCYKILRSIQDAVKDTRKSLGGSNER